MRIINIMQNGEIRDSVDGLVIKSEDFYRVLNGIQKRKVHKEKKQ